MINKILNDVEERLTLSDHENTKERYLVVDYGTLIGKMQELEKSCSNE